MPRGPIPRPALERFMEKVSPEPNTGCWLWTAAIGSKNGYARMALGSRLNGTATYGLAHRFAYETFIGIIPDDLELDHLCRVRSCVNPWHLEPVTRLENIMRGARKNAITHCPQGHPYSGDNLRIRPTGNRACRTCALEGARRWAARNPERRREVGRNYARRQRAAKHA